MKKSTIISMSVDRIQMQTVTHITLLLLNVIDTFEKLMFFLLNKGVGFDKVQDPVVHSVSKYQSCGLLWFRHSRSLCLLFAFKAEMEAKAKAEKISLLSCWHKLRCEESFPFHPDSLPIKLNPSPSYWHLLCGNPLTTHSSSIDLQSPHIFSVFCGLRKTRLLINLLK